MTIVKLIFFIAFGFLLDAPYAVQERGFMQKRNIKSQRSISMLDLTAASAASAPKDPPDTSSPPKDHPIRPISVRVQHGLHPALQGSGSDLASIGSGAPANSVGGIEDPRAGIQDPRNSPENPFSSPGGDSAVTVASTSSNEKTERPSIPGIMALSDAPPEIKTTIGSFVYVIPDLHGDFIAAVRTLQLAGILGEDQRTWVGGDSILIQLGDIVDRGDNAREIYELLFYLQDEAPKYGGRVILILGNHELIRMGLRQDWGGCNESNWKIPKWLLPAPPSSTGGESTPEQSSKAESSKAESSAGFAVKAQQHPFLPRVAFDPPGAQEGDFNMDKTRRTHLFLEEKNRKQACKNNRAIGRALGEKGILVWDEKRVTPASEEERNPPVFGGLNMEKSEEPGKWKVPVDEVNAWGLVDVSKQIGQPIYVDGWLRKELKKRGQVMAIVNDVVYAHSTITKEYFETVMLNTARALVDKEGNVVSNRNDPENRPWAGWIGEATATTLPGYSVTEPQRNQLFSELREYVFKRMDDFVSSAQKGIVDGTRKIAKGFYGGDTSPFWSRDYDSTAKIAPRLFSWLGVRRLVVGHSPGKTQDNGDVNESPCEVKACQGIIVVSDVGLAKPFRDANRWAQLTVLKFHQTKNADEFPGWVLYENFKTSEQTARKLLPPPCLCAEKSAAQKIEEQLHDCPCAAVIFDGVAAMMKKKAPSLKKAAAGVYNKPFVEPAVNLAIGGAITMGKPVVGGIGRAIDMGQRVMKSAGGSRGSGELSSSSAGSRGGRTEGADVGEEVGVGEVSDGKVGEIGGEASGEASGAGDPISPSPRSL